MKKILSILSLAAILFACSEELDNSFTPSNQVDTVNVTGQLMKLAYDVNGNEISVPHEGAIVTVTVENRDLYPNSSNPTGSVTYTSQPADANGTYTVSGVKIAAQNANTSAVITFVGGIGTRDTVVFIDGASTTRTGRTVSYSNVKQNANLSATGSVSFDLSRQDGVDEMFTSDADDDGNNISVGNATVQGELFITYVRMDTTIFGDTFYVDDTYLLSNREVKMVFDVDPTTQSERTYVATTGAQGRFTFNIETSDDASFNNEGEIMIFDFATTKDTIALGGARITGPSGVYEGTTRTVSGLDPFEIRINQDISYSTFTQE